jgi:uncharacterized membrane protein YgdD (TMEM256/DUF423 family)
MVAVQQPRTTRSARTDPRRVVATGAARYNRRMADARSGWISIGALNAALAVAAGAFAAHGLRERLDARALEVFETGARYHLYHALAIIAAGLVASSAARGAQTAAWMFQIGIVLFSGSLYALALSGVKGLGAITPIGGLAFLAGWLWLAWTAWRG